MGETSKFYMDNGLVMEVNNEKYCGDGGQEWGIGAYNGTSSCNGGKV